MSLNTPAQKDSLAQLLYRVAAGTGLDLNLDQLTPTLHDVREHSGAGGVESIGLELRVDFSSPTSMRNAAARIRMIADQVDAAAEKKETA